ncbi:M15 family metallopeptidase [Frondihabitans peucedani]|uniref:M15 family metallopeptidase n=1 Tax=Frondihabitans peucedani TaxID=598626 RepID=A0ABP8E477_9MICO
MIVLLSDPLVSRIPVADDGEPLVRLGRAFGDAGALVRRSLADRLEAAAAALPAGFALRVVEGHRSPRDQLAIIRSYSGRLRKLHPAVDADRLRTLTSRFVSPLEVAPHVAGAAVDLTLVGRGARPLDLGTEVDATPEQSSGACYFAATNISDDARANRETLAAALGGEGLVNYPTEWWHWSYGDRYWALMTGAAEALYGPVDRLEVVA